MAFRVINKTLTGGNDQLTTTHTPARGLMVWNDSANAAVILLGDKNIPATNFGYSIAKGTSTPFIAGSGAPTFNLDEVYLRGTLNDIARVIYLS